MIGSYKLFRVRNGYTLGHPHDTRIRRERYYQSLFYLIFRLMGFHMHTEIRTAASRIHATVELDSGVWIFEFDLDGGAEKAAPARIWAKDCAEPYRAAGKSVYLVGIGFDSEQRNVDE
uniref:PD-(D/E)XK nuclease superfamily protein n=1 Tax=Candidatus Kentrum sp. TC TaxID=2126339 RepID=A0A450ZF44_9GAMM|nr:MAG: PD-(D/E)XK nuclease superfamily protein [Candidatus Kentron sp. TC]